MSLLRIVLEVRTAAAPSLQPPLGEAVTCAESAGGSEDVHRKRDPMLAARGSKCLVTGAAGLIGSHLAERLVALGHDVRVVDNLSTGDEANLAGLDGEIEFLRGDLCELQACLEAGVSRIVYSSSSAVYGDTTILPQSESFGPLPRSPYAASKLAAEQYVLAFARAGTIEGVALRYFNVFGPRQSPHSAYAAVIPNFLQAALDGCVAELYGDGQQTRDFTYVDNV